MTIAQRRNRIKRTIKNRGYSLTEVALNIKNGKEYKTDNSKIKSMLNGLENAKTNKTFTKYEELFVESLFKLNERG